MRAILALVAAMALAGPAATQGLSVPNLGGAAGNIPGLGRQQETPEQKRAFCQRVAGAARQCGLGLDVTALSTCLVRSLPTQDSMRVAQVANNARGNAGSLLSDCGISR
jgi:hypothetical protein